MLCSPTGYGYGHDDRVLPLHLHHSGKVPPGPAQVGVGLPWDKVSLVGTGAAARGGPGWTCLPKAVGVPQVRAQRSLCGPPTLRSAIVLCLRAGTLEPAGVKGRPLLTGCETLGKSFNLPASGSFSAKWAW